jgi:DNA-binding beta-propeller fold protein YncE
LDRRLRVAASNDYIYVSSCASHRIIVYSIATAQLVGVIGTGDGSASSAPSGFNYPRGLAFGPGYQRLYIIDAGNNRVQVFGIGSGHIGIRYPPRHINQAIAIVDGEDGNLDPQRGATPSSFTVGAIKEEVLASRKDPSLSESSDSD